MVTRQSVILTAAPHRQRNLSQVSDMPKIKFTSRDIYFVLRDYQLLILANQI